MTYDLSALESLIAKHGPRLMKEGMSAGSGVIRKESRPKRKHGGSGKYKLISDQTGELILKMHAAGMGCTEIGADLRIRAESIRDHLRKNGVKSNPAKTKALRSSEYKGVVLTRNK